ncbi:probable endo-1,4-beta-xylanase [Serendipita indica DSM 11827]|uniref:Beta-xylanase n=1 Tax=Serendipita indica (strain DSM 11827) TaxID=1109443 RepID=G4TGH7_SERID|nr:probable endo-1,4-beta-xylanase [Serendipita indica DSM 11827]
MVQLSFLSLVLAATSAVALELFVPEPCTFTATPTPTTSIPVGKRDPKGLDALAQRKRRYFGVAFDVNRMSDAAYTQLILAQFGQITAENSLKWETTEPSRGVFNFTNGDIVVKTAQRNKMSCQSIAPLRAHTLVWHSQLPSWVGNGNFTKKELISVMKNHINNVAGHYRGVPYAWDVVNEAFNEDGSFRQTVFYSTIGEEYIDIAFKQARLVDPKALLAINDYNIDGQGPKSTAMINLVKNARKRGVPIDQIGAQAHLVVGTLPTTIRENWQAMANLGVWVAVTELDIRMPTPANATSLAQQAADYKTVVNACLAVSRCVGVTVWGASDKYSWVPEVFSGEGAPLPYDDNLAPKPAYNAIVQALKA